MQLPEQQASGRRFLFVEEEDIDDIEKYDHEDDFVCPDLVSTSSSCKKVCHMILSFKFFLFFRRVVASSIFLGGGTGKVATRKPVQSHFHVDSLVKKTIYSIVRLLTM